MDHDLNGRRMRSTLGLLAPLALLPVLGGCSLFRSDADVFAVSAKDAYRALADPVKAIQAFGTNQAGSFSNGSREVVWWQESYVRVECRIKLAELAADKTKVSVDCGPGAGQKLTVVPMTLAQLRDAAIEMVDATLTGRPFDPGRESRTASRWPDNDPPKPLAAEPPADQPADGADPSPDGWYDDSNGESGSDD